MKTEAGLEVADDGIWWISAQDYHKYFRWTTANPDVQDEHLSYHAVFDLDTPEPVYERMKLTSADD